MVCFTFQSSPCRQRVAHLDGHAGAVKTHGEKGALATHALETSSKLDLGDGEGVSEVEGSVHVGVAEGADQKK